MGTPKELVRPFGNKGVKLKVDPSLMGDGDYQELTNLVSNVEGTLEVRLGALELAVFNANSYNSGAFAAIHSITKLAPVFYAVSQNEIIYIGLADQILVSNTALGGLTMVFASVASGCCNASGTTISSQRFSDVEFPIGGLTLKFFACPLKMLKGYLNAAPSIPLVRWGIIPPLYPVLAQNTSTGTGPVPFTGAETPYLYMYTYTNAVGSESNPPVPMLAGITPNGNEIQLKVAQSPDVQAPGALNINIYRSGGSFADSLYRLIGTATPNTTLLIPFTGYIYNDVAQDQDIASNPILEFDNDAPVTAGLPTEWTATVASYASGTGAAGAVSTLNLTFPSGYTTNAGDFATPGTIFTIGVGLPVQEVVSIISSTATTITAWLQNAHSVASAYAVSCQAQTGAPCTIACSAFDSIFLAGDRFNPQMLYKSKNGSPESFGVLEFSTGIVDAISVGSSSDEIMALVEYNGTLICMNRESIYYVSLFQAQMQTPVKSPAKRGLIASKAYVKVSNEIWYLSYDGIYSFAGGEETWRSEDLDPLFHGIAVGNYLPIDLTPGEVGVGLDVIEMIFFDNQIVMNYTDTERQHHTLRFHTKLHRWSIDNYTTPFGQALIFSLYAESDFGQVFMGVNQQASSPNETRIQFWLAEIGTSDGWVNTPSDGQFISWAESQNTVELAPSMDKLFSDVSLESKNPGNGVQITSYYDWSLSAAETFMVPANGSRARYPFPLNNSNGQLAYAMMIRAAGASTVACSIYSLTIHYWELTQYTRGLAFDFSDEGYPDDKIFRWLDMEIDTGGITATLIIQIDSETTAFSAPIQTTYSARNITVSMPSNLIGRMVRLVLIPGSGGKINFYKKTWSYAKEPAALTAWDSYEMTFGYNGYSWMKQCWLEYLCPSDVTITFYSDGDNQFFQKVLPAHPQREVERFYFPAYVGLNLNKSKTHRFTLIATSPCKLYKESSRLEWLVCGADQRGAYQQAPLSDLMQAS